jgi:O-antigen ligase
LSNNYLKIFYNTFPTKLNFFIISILLSVPAILLGDWKIFILPLLFFAILYLVIGERFLMVFIVVTLFTLVGELNESLRVVVHLVDFALIGFLFLRKFGLNFQDYPRVPKSIIYFLVLFFGAMIISSSVSSYPLAGLGMIIQQLAFFVIVYVFYSLISNKRDIENYIIAIILVGVILVSVSLSTFFTQGYGIIDIIAKDRVRISSLLSNPEALSNFYVVSFPFIIAFILFTKKVSSKLLGFILLIYISIGIILTMSRSSILAILLSTSIILFLLRRKIFYRLLVAICALVLLTVLYEPLNEFASLFLRIEEGMSARDQLWNMSVNIIRDNPIFGIGPGAYKHVFFNYLPFMLDEFWGKIMIEFYNMTGGENFSHNYFLVLFTDLGLLGIITAITLPLIYLTIGIKTIKKYRPVGGLKYHLIIALFAVGVSVILRNFFNSIGLIYLGGITTNLPFWLFFSSLIYFYKSPILAEKIS